ncbi:ATP-binding protein [Franzmannia qiaohouensis]|uniref:histidine kinase n=1 Tax=Franzmannia qiaohouensis TaxID=1329370 RepID=A0ABU1HA79_9GAMM|nr:ATP-binding protein [Halomonas qiaohouensis]MDR5904355.1 ATP-binding protein [Halomonas qiaohouensis]
MSLRARLSWTLGLTLLLTWGAAAAWLMWDLREEVERTLDRRLAQSARMVADLVVRLPDASSLSSDRQLSMSVPFEGMACRVSSAQGERLASTHSGLDGVLDDAEPGYAYRQEGEVSWRVYTLVHDGVRITTAERVNERRQLLGNIAMVAVVPFVIALLGSLVAVALGVWRSLRPLDHWCRELELRDRDDLSPVTSRALPQELGPLARTLNGLLSRMRRSISREQQFSADAAHELRTPLTAIKTHLQVAMRVDERASRHALLQATEGVTRLEGTLEQLLALARIDTSDEGASSGACCLSEVLVHCVDEARVRAGHQRVRVSGEIPAVTVALSCEMLSLVVRNLLDNALVHGPEEAEVSLSAATEPSGGDGIERVAVRIVDQGHGIAAESLEKVTQRFWHRADSSGVGLGLAIVQAILDHVDGRLVFQTLDSGFEAHVSLPCHAR